MRKLKLFSAYAVAFGLAGALASACISVNYSDTAFRCNPRQGGDACPDGYQCCSDDPTNLSGVALFSDAQNLVGTSGMCVTEGVNAGLANGCPVPCNPQWPTAQKEGVCGPSATALCCQTTALEPEDCIYDVNDTCFRPVTGNDIDPVDGCPIAELQANLQALGYENFATIAKCNTDWSGSAHMTHQDPGLPSATGCNFLSTQLGGADPSGWFLQCVRALTVADQRGFCLQKSPDVQVCPTDLTDAEKIANGIPLDACAEINQALGLFCG